ncbi:MAG: 2-isopropylmalate synthase [Candidatus Carsonella ruddii]
MFNLFSNYINKSPDFVSEDLRDGNQSIINGYNIKEKINIWNIILDIGIKQIVIGFPSSNKHDYNFIKYLIKNNLIPKDIYISILIPCKKKLIDFSFNCVKKIENVIFHLYNSISKNQRKKVFKFKKKEILIFTLENIKYLIKNIIKKKKNSNFQYSPESFSDSEIFFSKKISFYFSYLCYINKIKSILNLPITVDNIYGNVYINYLKYIKKNIFNSVLSTHIHNDMLNGISNSMLVLLLNINRIEGTLLGNGERTGNTSLMILASNLYNLGINSNIKIFNNKNFNYFKNEKISLKNRFPWLSRLNYSAFSGSHQDAIFKSYYKKKKFNWKVIYISINPKIFNFSHKNIIKINSQSGKGGLKFILWYNYNILLNNNNILINLYKIIQDIAEILMIELYKEFILSILFLKSNNIFLKKFKFFQFYFTKLYNFKIFIVLIKKKNKKIIKIIILKYE